MLDGINPVPWQTDTCIGNWHYLRGVTYKTSKQVIDLMVDIVSKNGNLLLNFPLPNSGELDAEEIKTLDGVTAWMQVNSEGIYATKPWKIFGEGPAIKPAGAGRRSPEIQRESARPLGRQGHPLHRQGVDPVRVRDGVARGRSVPAGAGDGQSSQTG